MSIFNENNAVLNDHMLKHRRLVAEFSITAHATPASKKHNILDLPGVMFLATEGKLTDVSAVETITGLTGYTAPADATNAIFDILLKGGSDGLGNIKKVHKITVTEKTALAGGGHVTLGLGDKGGLTPGGNIAIEITTTGLDLASESPTYLVEVEYQLA